MSVNILGFTFFTTSNFSGMMFDLFNPLQHLDLALNSSCTNKFNSGFWIDNFVTSRPQFTSKEHKLFVVQRSGNFAFSKLDKRSFCLCNILMVPDSISLIPEEQPARASNEKHAENGSPYRIGHSRTVIAKVVEDRSRLCWNELERRKTDNQKRKTTNTCMKELKNNATIARDKRENIQRDLSFSPS